MSTAQVVWARWEGRAEDGGGEARHLPSPQGPSASPVGLRSPQAAHNPWKGAAQTLPESRLGGPVCGGGEGTLNPPNRPPHLTPTTPTVPLPLEFTSRWLSPKEAA